MTPTAPSRPQSDSGAASTPPVSAEAKESDGVPSEPTPAGAVAVGLQAAAREPERKPTAHSADVSKHASVQAVASPAVDSSESGARTEPEDTSERPSGDGEEDLVANPSPNWRGNGNANGASKGTPNSNATQGDRASADEASPPANGGATKGGAAHSESDPNAHDAAAPHGPSASNSNDNSNGNGNGNGDGAAHSAPDAKGKNAAPTQGPSVSNGNGNAHAQSDPITNSAAAPHGPSASNGNGNSNSNGPVHTPSDAKGAAAASPQPTVGTRGIGVAQSTPRGSSASQGAIAPNGASNASTVTAQAGHNGEHTSSPPPSQAPVKHGPTGPSPSPAIASAPSHAATPAAPPATGQQSAGNRG